LEVDPTGRKLADAIFKALQLPVPLVVGLAFILIPVYFLREWDPSVYPGLSRNLKAMHISRILCKPL
jgi:hypothetical protein